MKKQTRRISGENTPVEKNPEEPSPGATVGKQPAETAGNQADETETPVAGDDETAKTEPEKSETGNGSPTENPDAPADETDAAEAETGETDPPDAPAVMTPAMESLIAEAENRGYLRGRNERISELMREPAVYQRQSSPAAAPGDRLLTRQGEEWQGDSRPMILNNPRVSIWDR